MLRPPDPRGWSAPSWPGYPRSFEGLGHETAAAHRPFLRTETCCAPLQYPAGFPASRVGLTVVQVRHPRFLQGAPPPRSRWVANAPFHFATSQRGLEPTLAGPRSTLVREAARASLSALVPGPVIASCPLFCGAQGFCGGGLRATSGNSLPAWRSSRTPYLPVWRASRNLGPLVPLLERFSGWWHREGSATPPHESISSPRGGHCGVFALPPYTYGKQAPKEDCKPQGGQGAKK